MRNILGSSGSAMRGIEPSAIRPWRFANLARHVSTLVLDEEQLKRYLQRYEELAAAARSRLQKGRLDTGSPEVKPQIVRG